MLFILYHYLYIARRIDLEGASERERESVCVCVFIFKVFIGVEQN